jgi:hypothetical protein
VGRDFWIVFLPLVVGFAATYATLATGSGIPLFAAAAFGGAFGVVYCRRLAPYTGYAALFGGGGFDGEPLSPALLALGSALIMLAGVGGLALYAADSLSIVDIDRDVYPLWRFRFRF